jgi:hypothetical protein
MSNPTHASVRHTPLRGKPMAECLSALGTMCDAGTQCAEVQASQVALQALGGLKSAVTTASTSLSAKQSLAQALLAAMKALGIDFIAVSEALRVYEAAVGAIAHGDASIINKAGCQSRVQGTPAASPLGKVSVVHGKPWKHSAESLLTWPRGPGATGYAIQVNFTPQNPAGTWDNLIPGTGRRRIVKAPAPGAQFLARVASLGSGGTQSEWSDPVLVTTAF